MGWLASLVVAMVAGGLGLVAAGLVMNACVGWYRISSFEGKAGYAVVMVALLGGVAGAGVGLVTARVASAGGMPGFLRTAALAGVIVVGAAALSAGIARLLADVPPTIAGQELMLDIEVRLPVSVTARPGSDGGASFLELHSVASGVARRSERGDLRPAEARLEEGRWVVPGSVFLFTERGQRSVSLTLDDQPLLAFQVPLPARPTRADEAWSKWGPRPPAPNPPWPDTKPSCRFRVRRIVPPPPGPSPEDLDAQAAAAEQARFEALPLDAPVGAWLPWTRDGAPEARLAAAVARMTARPSFVEELSSLMVDADAEVAADALRVIAHVPQPPPGLVPAVAEAGHRLAARIRAVNATPPEQDPGYQGAAEVAVRFTAWIDAVRELRARAGADLTPELGEILVLSRARPDSQAMQRDVLRVASYYMHQWTGLAPLPADPPPR